MKSHFLALFQIIGLLKMKKNKAYTIPVSED